jgi:hypothetical protein
LLQLVITDHHLSSNDSLGITEEYVILVFHQFGILTKFVVLLTYYPRRGGALSLSLSSIILAVKVVH